MYTLLQMSYSAEKPHQVWSVEPEAWVPGSVCECIFGNSGASLIPGQLG